jgi:gamma-D-glutamyl-L-lysine dipeptidyl-peptidase
VATLWRAPSSARAVDRPALANPAGIRQWLSRMTLTDRRGLNGRADTQALMGDRVIVVARSGSWVKVVVPDQPTPLDARGYPGWVPTAQLTASRPVASGLVATVVARTTYLRTDNPSVTPVTEISFGTRLPRVGATGAWVRVATPTGRVLRLAASVVSVRAPNVAALAPAGGDVVRTARMFSGLPYLWAGRSGFGFDCSGLTSLDLRAHGVIIPRDADAQARKGRAVSRTALRPGDLLFYATRGHVHHVSIYAGGGRMVQAPKTGSTVQTITLSTPAYAREYAGARRAIG